MSKKISLGAALALLAIIAAIAVSLTYVFAMSQFNDKVADINERQAMYVKLSEIDQKVRKDFIGTIDETALNDGIAAGYISGLKDINGRYMSAEQYKEYLNSSESNGKSVGVGVYTIQDQDGNMEIIEVLPGSAAEKSGLKKGDTIIAVDESDVIRITYATALSRMEGTSGSSVNLDVLRTTVADDGTESVEKRTFSVVRTEYQAKTVTAEVINGNVGYIALNSFRESGVEDFQDAVDQFTEQNVSGLVIDLRNNSGGSIEAMAEMLDILLPSGNTVTYIDKNGDKIVEYQSDAKQTVLPISVVVNQGTYSEAELFAQAIRDFNKGLLIGEKTSGYGSKDEVLPLSDGSAMILSTGYYIGADGATFNGEGLEVDIDSTLSTDAQEKLKRRNLPYAEDIQIQAAVTALLRQGAEVQEVPGSSSSQPAESSQESSSQPASSSTGDTGESSAASAAA